MNKAVVTGLIQVIVLLILLYVAYKWYQKNYTPEGIAQQKLSEEQKQIEIDTLAKKLKQEFIRVEYTKCELFPFEQLQWNCKQQADAKSLATDWKEEARYQLGY